MIIVINRKTALIVLTTTMFLLALLIQVGNMYLYAINDFNNYVIAIDPGHGGHDPGALGNDGTKEKNINLIISKALKKLLEDKGYQVIMTREDDVSLHDLSAHNKKASDLRNRKKLIEENNAKLLVSIHMNSFSQGKYYGAQTFYKGNDEESKKIASFIQNELREKVDINNMRKIKPINDLFMFKDLGIQAVLVECGFLSNPNEENLLNDSEYQKKLAQAICNGICKYIHQRKNKESNIKQ